MQLSVVSKFTAIPCSIPRAKPLLAPARNQSPITRIQPLRSPTEAPTTVCHCTPALSPTAESFKKVSQLTLLFPFIAALASTPLGAVYGPSFTEAGRVSLLFLLAALIPNAVALNCLQEAAQHGRTSTPTYTRLNSAFQLTIIAGVAALVAMIRDGISALGTSAYFKMVGVQATTVGIVLSMIMLARACKGFYDLQKGAAEKSWVLDTLRLGVAILINPLFFWSSFLGGMFSALTAQLLYLLFKHLQSNVDGVLRAEQLWLTALMLLPITCSALLKDAADRGRLGATTYRKLSIALASMALVHMLGAIVWNLMGGPFTLPARMFVSWAFMLCLGGYAALCG